MSYQNLKKNIKKNEGFSPHTYKDQLGYITIGYGHLILSNEKYLTKRKINKKKLERIFDYDFNKALEDFNLYLGSLVVNSKEKELLIQMIFQMGIKKVQRFKKLLHHLKIREKHLVCFEMMNSLWYKQTPIRVKKLVKIILKK